ncbi:hypothetical protein LTR35_017228 [Friedmanniomyces endolithicus]|nr:hypothetical protein LTR35_017228 [Friedmanniomyces endolithicus]KAK0822901.1 hypothetical protein LTR73_008938 [Friedmanniomyces endolithicus]
MRRRSKDVSRLVERLRIEKQRFHTNEVIILPREQKKSQDMLDLRTRKFMELKETARIRRRIAGQRLEDVMTLGIEVFFLCTQILTVSTLCGLESHFVDQVGAWWRSTEYPFRLKEVAQKLFIGKSESGVREPESRAEDIDTLHGETDCVIMLVPMSRAEDMSINLRVGHEMGLQLIDEIGLQTTS